MELRYYNELKVGDVVNIYTNYKLETPDSFEGHAILIKKVDTGHSFTLYNEKLHTLEEDRVVDSNGKYLPLTKEQMENNGIYEAM